MELSEDERAMLEQAIARADTLLTELIEQQAELERHPPKIAESQLAVGRMALQNAIASARRTVVALRDAQTIARSLDGDPDDPDNDDDDDASPAGGRAESTT